jgi:Raf kinase inhibitor-like YbhB/YbcL family protein
MYRSDSAIRQRVASVPNAAIDPGWGATVNLGMTTTISVRAPDPAKHGNSLRVASDSFPDGGKIPMDNVFTGCGGKNVSPQLSWTGAPDGTKGYAITCFDPDAPTGCGYWHWLAFNVPGNVTSLTAGQSPAGIGYNDFGMSAYCGPCPPKGYGDHRYVFTVYALDIATIAGASAGMTGATLVFQMRGHVLATGSITGTFGH